MSNKFEHNVVKDEKPLKIKYVIQIGLCTAPISYRLHKLCPFSNGKEKVMLEGPWMARIRCYSTNASTETILTASEKVSMNESEPLLVICVTEVYFIQASVDCLSMLCLPCSRSDLGIPKNYSGFPGCRRSVFFEENGCFGLCGIISH